MVAAKNHHYAAAQMVSRKDVSEKDWPAVHDAERGFAPRSVVVVVVVKDD